MKQKKKKGNEDLANILPHTPVPESANKNTRRRKKKQQNTVIFIDEFKKPHQLIQA